MDLAESLVYWKAARKRYDNPGKRKARAVPMRILERLPRGARYLDLSGGGRSAEEARRRRPDVEIVSADKSPSLWPALRAHAVEWSYTALCGSFTRASGLFDLIYLDLTGNSSEQSMKLVYAAVKMLAADGRLVVTITPDHELDGAVSLNRPPAVAALLMSKTELQIVGLFVYPNHDRKRVTLAVLSGPAKFMNPVAITRALESRSRYSYWAKQGSTFMFGGNSTRSRASDQGRRKHNQRVARYRQRHPELIKARLKEYRSTDEYKKIAADRQRELRKMNPERYREYDRRATPRKVARAKERYATEPTYRELIKADRRARYARKKLTAVSGTTVEAVFEEAA